MARKAQTAKRDECLLRYEPIDRNYRDSQKASLERALSKEERLALRFYVGRGYRSMNDRLRKDGVADRQSARLIAAILKMPPTPAEIVLYRGLHIVSGMESFDDFWRHMKVGGLYKALGFHSFSQDPVHANRFAHPWGSVVRVVVPAGSHLIYNEDEKEWIAPHGSLYRFDGSVVCGCKKKKPPIVGAVELDLDINCRKTPRRLFQFTIFTSRNPPNRSNQSKRPNQRSRGPFSRLHPPA